MSTESDQGFELEFPDYSGSRCLPDHSENVTDSLSYWHQSFSKVSKSIGRWLYETC